MEFIPCSFQPESIRAYQLLFAKCFPSARHMTESYLNWLYGSNPEGAVVGFDAFDGEKLVAHYACVPANATISNQHRRGLLSLNTATHPDYQGKGLFTKLATATYEHAANNGYSFVYGVANANSTPGFIKKLGFTLVTPLDAKVGIGRLSVGDWKKTIEAADFRRSWTADSFKWRINNPANPATVATRSDGSVAFECSSRRPLIRAYGETWLDELRVESNGAILPGAKVFIGLFPAPVKPYRTYVTIPAKFRPSVLNLIYRDLLQSSFNIETSGVLLNFFDFDAF